MDRRKVENLSTALFIIVATLIENPREMKEVRIIAMRGWAKFCRSQAESYWRLAIRTDARVDRSLET